MSEKQVVTTTCRHGEHTIEIDCAPFTARPDAYIAGVIIGTGLKSKEPISKLFGCWTWDYSEVSCDEWDKVQAITKPRLEALYHSGSIRYASW